MRDRLIELLDELGVIVNVPDKVDEDGCGTYTIEGGKYVAEYLLAKGVIVPPCKVGDTVYIIDEVEFEYPYVLDVVVSAIGYDIGGFWITMSLPLGMKQSAHVGERSFGKSVFLTQEEAEQALKGGVKG